MSAEEPSDIACSECLNYIWHGFEPFLFFVTTGTFGNGDVCSLLPIIIFSPSSENDPERK
jgi:hypothetical protein